MRASVFYSFAAIMLLIGASCATMKNHTKSIVDLTHPFDESTVYWPTEDGFVHEKEVFGQTEKGYFYSSYRFQGAEHGGTHLDAPIHFNEKGQTLDQIPLTNLVASGVVLDVTEQCAHNRDYLVQIEDFLAFEKQHGISLNNMIVLIKTGFSRFWPDRLNYLGTDEKGVDAVSKLHFPGLDPQATLWLVTDRHIKAVGIDTASIDFGQSTLFESHRNLFKYNVPAFENVANLDFLPSHGFDIVALPMKIKDGSGGPLRIIALIH
jgi:kynurenine formamidase